MTARLPNGRVARIEPEEKFWRSVVKGESHDDCWMWAGLQRESGYGYLTDYWRKILAHRFAYELLVGPIPEGLFVCHRCDVKLCVNPRHLYAGTPKQNVSDAIERGLFPQSVPPAPLRGSTHPRSRLTEPAVLDIRARYAAGDTTVRGLAETYGVSSSLIHNIVRRKTWTHI